MSGKSVIPVSAISVFDHKGIIAFYQVRECLSVYSNCENVQHRRDIGLQIVDLLEDFLRFEFKEEEVRYLDGLLAALKKSHSKEQKPPKKSDKKENFSDWFDSFIKPRDSNIQTSPNPTRKPKAGIFESLKILSPIGIKLLEIKGDIDLQTLKRLYKKAAIQHHPDRGGTTENMQAINEAYSLFHDAVLSYRPDVKKNEISSFYPKNLGELEFTIRVVLGSIYGDCFAGDLSYGHLVIADKLIDRLDAKSLGHFFNGLTDYFRVLSTPSKALIRLNMKKELSVVAKISARFFDLYVNHYIPTDEYPNPPDREWLPTDESLSREREVKLVINHAAQAFHAFRLGIIDEKRFLAAKKKYSYRKDVIESRLAAVKEFYSKNGFQFNISKYDYTVPDVRPAVVTPLFWFVRRYDHLDDDQKWQYLEIFKNGEISAKIEDYLRIRTQDILMGLIHCYDDVDKPMLKKEIAFFCKTDIFPSEYVLIEEFLGHLESLDRKERSKKLKLLAELDETDSWSARRSAYTVASFDLFNDEPDDYKMEIRVSSSYVEFAISTIKEIESFKSNGNINNSFKESWTKDLEALSNFEKSAIGKARQNAWLRTKNPSSEKTISSHEPYILGLLKLGKTFHPKNTGQLQLGYSINRLTAAYSRERNWEKIIYWIELFFDLPINYRDRQSRGEKETLKKRLERAKIEIRRLNGKPKLLSPPVEKKKVKNEKA